MSTKKRVDWSPKKRATALTLRSEGYSYGEIAKKLGSGATASGVRKLYNRFQMTGTIENKEGKGRKKLTSPTTDRRLVRLALGNRRLTARNINNILSDTGISVSDRTVSRRLAQAGLKARRPRKKPFLNTVQRRKRVEWAKEHLSWSTEDWKRVIWSDETKISIFGSDGIQYVRRRPGEDLLPECLNVTVKHPLSVMIWGCMSWHGVGRIQVLSGTINANRYIQEILEPKLLASASQLFGSRDFIFQQDGAPCHTAKLCKKWFADKNIKVLPWPGNSPDLNPIENLWSRLKRVVASRRPGNKQVLIESIINSWFHIIEKENLQKLVDSMPRRCQAVIDAKGFPTRY